MTKEIISLVAPMSLPGGYEFDGTIDNRSFRITVPDGGVLEGEVLQVPIDELNPGDKVIASISSETEENSKGERKKHSRRGSKSFTKKNISDINASIPPEGVWRKSFYSCFDVLDQPSYLLTLIFPWVLIGQLMQRLKLNFWGCRTEDYQNTCNSVFFFGLLALLVEGILVLLFLSFKNAIYMTLASAVFVYTSISFLYCSFMLRHTLRKEFSLPTTIVKDCPCDDFCTSLCCCYWCSLLQISRHTHDEDVFKYQFVSATGLPNIASEIYYCQ